jgi:hypothetical protein
MYCSYIADCVLEHTPYVILKENVKGEEKGENYENKGRTRTGGGGRKKEKKNLKSKINLKGVEKG